MASAGALAFIVTYLLTKKPAPLPSPPASVHQDVKQEVSPQVKQEINPQINVNPQFSPQFNPVITIAAPDTRAEEQEHARQEQMVLACLRRKPFSMKLVDDVSSEVGLDFDTTNQALKSLFAKEMIYRSPGDVRGDFVYWSDGPAGTTPHHNIKFVEIASGTSEQMRVFSRYAGQTLTFATAKFLNEAIKGRELLTPRVKARAIYRRPDGVPILDISNVPWVPGPGNQIYETFEVNTPRHVLLFFLARNTRFASSVQQAVPHDATGRNGWVPQTHDYELREPIGSVEVQLLTDREQIYALRLEFVDGAMNTLPLCTGFTEL